MVRYDAPDISDHMSFLEMLDVVNERIIERARGSSSKGTRSMSAKDEPQYEIKSEKTDNIAMHKGSALRKLLR